jgi:hypothetical protein
MAASSRPPLIINKLILKEIEAYYAKYQVKAENWNKNT